MIFDLLNVKAWAMESSFISRAYPLAVDLINKGHDLSRLMALQKEASVFPGATGIMERTGLPIYKAANGSKVAMMRVSGGMTKNGELCSYGMRHYSMLIDAVNASPNVDALVIEMDTPGGSVDGTPELGQAIKNSDKSIVVFADGMVASAGYWTASQASAIVANANNPTMLGSIGTLYVHKNYANVIEAGNFPNVEILRAPQSVDKYKVNPLEPLTAAHKAEVMAELKNMTEDFISTVKAGRGDRLQTGDENIFTGNMYPASQALAMGMIDAIGTRQEAIDMAGEYATQSKSNKATSVSAPAVSGKITNKSSMNFPKISSLFGKANAETTEELSAEEQANLEAAEQRLTEQETELTARVAKITELEAQVAELNTTIEGQNAVIEAHEATITEQTEMLDKKPAGAATTVIHQADEFEDGNNKYETSTDREVAEYAKAMEN